MEFPPAAQWAKDALAAYRNRPQRSSHSPRAPLVFINDLGPDKFKDVYPLAPSDTDQIISDYKRQIRLPPPGIDKGRLLYQLANTYRRRWLEKARPEDLDDAVLSLWYSLLNTPQGSRETTGTLEEFCYLLYRRFDETGEGGNIVGHIEYVKSKISKTNFGDELFLSRLLEVSTELENMIERRRMSCGIQQQEARPARTEGAYDAWFRRYQEPGVQEDSAARRGQRSEDWKDIYRDIDDKPNISLRHRKKRETLHDDVDDKPSAPLRDRQRRATLDDDVDERPSAPLRRATERIFSSFGRWLDKVLPDDAASAVPRSSSSSGD